MFPSTKKELDAIQAKYTKRYSEKDKKEVIQRFKKAYPEIMAFEPEVKMLFTDEVAPAEHKDVEVYIFDPPIPEISIFRRIIFDTRLVPDTFEDMKVTVHFWACDYPKEYIMSFSDLNETVFRKYIDDHIAEIRAKFNNPKLSKQEAFKPITDGLL